MVCAVKALSTLVVGKTLKEIVSDFRGFYRLLSSDGQMRWVSITTMSSATSVLSRHHVQLIECADELIDRLDQKKE